ncbi:MAG: hypothetical protein HWN68_16680 [Desulfobacterales bacterium]|nr:hypothetical protein [Desulfobacterales bacterium]
MGWFREYPYAAKAQIEFDFEDPLTWVWVTFRLPMDQAVKPADDLWICRADGVLKAIAMSGWLDFWTMVMFPADILARPETLTIEYDGPDPLLHTTWGKQWEPWGPILAIDITT